MGNLGAFIVLFCLIVETNCGKWFVLLIFSNLSRQNHFHDRISKSRYRSEDIKDHLFEFRRKTDNRVLVHRGQHHLRRLCYIKTPLERIMPCTFISHTKISRYQISKVRASSHEIIKRPYMSSNNENKDETLYAEVLTLQDALKMKEG